MLRLRQGTLQAGGLHHRDTEHVLGLPAEGDVVQLFVRQGFPREDALVYERFQIGRFYSQTLQAAEGGIFLLADDSQEQMIRADAVTAGAHGLFPGVFNDLVKVFRNL